VDPKDHGQDCRASACGNPREPQHGTVGRLPRQMKYSLRTNRKKITTSSSADRDRQFRYIRRQRTLFARRGDPVVSVDAKKRELIGNFKNPGVKWEQYSTDVNDHDFRSDSIGIGIPYGIYDTQANRGCVILGVSHETSAFAVSSICLGWRTEGRKRYSDSGHILILADTGGSNGSQRRAWKLELQQLCDRLRMPVTVCHYPAGVKVSTKQLSALPIQPKRVLPKWNYTIRPRV
jgi:hypothetical protein